MAVIQTAVDKLVKLVKERGKISIPEAAKILGVSESVIEEWASFLQDQGVIGINYRLATGYLVGRKLSKQEKVQRLKQFKETQDLFTVRAETMLEKLEKHSKGIEELESEFSKLKKGVNVAEISRDLEVLHEAEKERAEIQKRAQDIDRSIKNNIKSLHEKLLEEHRRYEEILSKRKEADKYIRLKKNKMELMRSKEMELEARVKKLAQSLINIKSGMEKESQKVHEIKESYQHLAEIENELTSKIKEHKKTVVELEKLTGEKDREIEQAQKAIVEKVKKAEKNLEREITKGEAKYKKFEKLFKARAKIEVMLKELDKEKKEMDRELRQIIKTAKAFRSSFKVPEQKKIQDLNKKMKKVEKSKSIFEKKARKLFKLIRGLK